MSRWKGWSAPHSFILCLSTCLSLSIHKFIYPFIYLWHWVMSMVYKWERISWPQIPCKLWGRNARILNIRVKVFTECLKAAQEGIHSRCAVGLEAWHAPERKLQFIALQSVVLEVSTSSSPGSLEEMQHLRPHSWSSKSESAFWQDPQALWCPKFIKDFCELFIRVHACSDISTFLRPHGL